MLGSPCSPCCGCTPGQTAAILAAIRAGSCSMQWESTGMRYQEAASFLDRPLTGNSNWNAYIYKQQEPPPASISLALDLSYTSATSVRFVAYSTDWRAEVLVGIGGAGSVWPGTNCFATMSAQLFMNGVTNWDRRYTPLYVGTPFVWQIDKSFNPAAVRQSLQYYYATTADLSTRCVLSATYAASAPTWPTSLDWAATQCNAGITGGWFSCVNMGVMGGGTTSPTVTESAASFSFAESPTLMLSGAYRPPYRWSNGVWLGPNEGGNTAQGRMTRIGATLTL